MEENLEYSTCLSFDYFIYTNLSTMVETLPVDTEIINLEMLVNNGCLMPEDDNERIKNVKGARGRPRLRDGQNRVLYFFDF